MSELNLKDDEIKEAVKQYVQKEYGIPDNRIETIKLMVDQSNYDLGRGDAFTASVEIKKVKSMYD